MTGSFEEGKDFDAILVNVDSIVTDEDDTPEDLLQRFLLCGDDRNIERVYVCGRQVKG